MILGIVHLLLQFVRNFKNGYNGYFVTISTLMARYHKKTKFSFVSKMTLKALAVNGLTFPGGKLFSIFLTCPCFAKLALQELKSQLAVLFCMGPYMPTDCSKYWITTKLKFWLEFFLIVSEYLILDFRA